MSIDNVDAPDNGVKRDRYSRPLVVPPDGKKPVPYTRVTTLAGVLEDTYNLSRWQQRMVAIGLVDRPDLVLAVAAHREDRNRMNDLAGQALEAAKAGAAATTGTALHALTEQLDRGRELGAVPEAYRADLDAYQAATEHLEHVVIEAFCVCDELTVGGTPDRISRLTLDQVAPDGTVLPAGTHLVVDTKTGQVEYGQLKIAVQLGTYAHCCRYDPDTGTRTDLPPVDQHWGLVVHLPAGKGRAELVWVDLAAGWEAAQLSLRVRDWRRRNDLLTPCAARDPERVEASSLIERAQAASTVVELEGLYFEARRTGTWTDDLLAACRARKAELNTAVSS